MKTAPKLVAVIVGIPTADVDVSFLLPPEKSDHELLVVHLGDHTEQHGEERLVRASVSSP